MSVSWAAFLAGRIHAADATTRTGGITGLERLEAIREYKQHAEEQMSRQSKADAAGWAAIHDLSGWESAGGRHHGGNMHGGGGHVPDSVSVGRKGQNRQLTKAQIRQIAAKQRAELKAKARTARAAKRGKK